MSDQKLYKHVTLPNTADKQPESRLYRGFSTTNPNIKNWKVYDIEIVKQDILNHFHIRQGEKLNDPTFGTIIWDLLYEPLTDAVKRLIAEDVARIVNYDPRIIVESINISTFTNGIYVDCELTYKNYNVTETLNLKFDKDSL